MPMEVDHVGDREPEEEDWEDADEIRRGSTFYNCGMMGHLERETAVGKCKGKWKGGDGGKGCATGKGKTTKGTGK